MDERNYPPAEGGQPQNDPWAFLNAGGAYPPQPQATPNPPPNPVPGQYPPRPQPQPTNEAPRPGRPEPAKPAFQLDISFDTMELSAGLDTMPESDAPVSKGEIYFSNPPAQTRTQSTAPVAKKRKKTKRKHSGAVVAVAMSLILLASGVLSWIGITALQDIFSIGKEEGSTITLTLTDDLTTNDVIDILAEKGLIKQKWVCKIYSRFSFWMRSQSLEDPSKAKLPVYLGDTYTVSTDLSLEELLNTFKSQPKSSETINLVFPEGYTILQVVAKIDKFNVTSATLLEKNLRTATFEYPFLQVLNNEQRFNPYEGYLFPDTYEFYISETPNSVLRRFFDNFNSKWSEEYDTRAKELGLTIDEVITLASIIQMEAANSKQMADVSGVLHNRLNNINVYPRLECDSTRDYVRTNIDIDGMDRNTADYYYQAYNTYQCTGLPAGPICNPGLDAIDAALYPKNHSYYYFQHDKYGEIYLNKTKAEHDKTTTKLVNEGIAQ